MSSDVFDLLVVGCGPAGMRAAVEARVRGLTVLAVDEGSGPGGQVYRAVAGGPFAGDPVLGADYARGRELVEAFEGSGLEACFGSAVFMLEKDADGSFVAGVVSGAETARLVHARAVIVAVGAQERPMPIPGWTLPGVMTAGAAQTLLKASALAPEGPVVIAGMGPLIWLLAAQYARLGVKIEALLDSTPPGSWRRALRHLPGFLFSRYALKGIGLLAEVRRSTRVHRVTDGIAAEGEHRLEAVRFRSGGREHRMKAATLLLHQGVAPQANLAMAAGAHHRWSDARRAFEPETSASFESSMPGLFLAGDAGGIGGADCAEAEGALAALAVLRSLGRGEDAAAEARWRALRRRALSGRAFLDALWRPSDEQVAPADDVVVCRCEEVTAGEMRDAVRRGARGPNQAKAFTRAGMGPCQGRMCGLTVNAIIAAETGDSPADVGFMRLRMPVKPVTVAQIATLSDDGA